MVMTSIGWEELMKRRFLILAIVISILAVSCVSGDLYEVSDALDTASDVLDFYSDILDGPYYHPHYRPLPPPPPPPRPPVRPPYRPPHPVWWL